MFPFWLDTASDVWLPWMSAAFVSVISLLRLLFGR